MEVAADALLKSDLLGLSAKPSVSRVNLEGKIPSKGRPEDPAGHSWKETPEHEYINATRDGFVS